jgi:CRISPR-associated protein Cmr6
VKVNYVLPNDSFEAKKNCGSIDNFALRLNKFPEVSKENGKYKFDLEKVVGSSCFDASKGEIDTFIVNYYSVLKSIPNIKIKSSSFIPDWRMVVGLGTPSVYDTSITLHHIYGFPYIPGQAVKGVTRSYVIETYFPDGESSAEKDTEFVKIFGSQKERGNIFFYDAYPVSKQINLELDIINVHYQDYYSENNKKPKIEPTDDLKIIPNKFLTVRDTEFLFFTGSKIKTELCIKGISVEELIKNALEKRGIGAKTSSGYGYLKKQASLNLSFQNKVEEKKKAEEEKILNSMTEFEAKIYKLEKQNNNDAFLKESAEILKGIDSHEKEDEKVLIAEAIKAGFKKFKKWDGKQSDKQKKKINQIKQILNNKK